MGPPAAIGEQFRRMATKPQLLNIRLLISFEGAAIRQLDFPRREQRQKGSRPKIRRIHERLLGWNRDLVGPRHAAITPGRSTADRSIQSLSYISLFLRGSAEGDPKVRR